jgi:hypothetical protein
MPSETPIFAATSDVGNRVINIRFAPDKSIYVRICATDAIYTATAFSNERSPLPGRPHGQKTGNHAAQPYR